LLAGLFGTQWAPGQFADEALVDRVVTLEPVIDVPEFVGDTLDQGSDRLGAGNVRHHELMLETLLFDVKARLHVVDGLAALDGDHTPRREAATVSDPVNFVENRDTGITGAQEIRVQRMDSTTVNRSSRRHQCLRRDLTTEGALTLSLGVLSSKRVELNRFDVEEIHKEI
jgi:hypothetical protein